MFFLELVGYSITLSYNIVQGNPFSTWGENLFLLLQTFIIVFLMFRFTTGINATFISITVGFAAALFAMISGNVPMEVMTLLQTSSIGIFVASKVPQVITNFKTRSTGKLAFFTFFLNFAGSSARVFTTLQEVSDKIILTSAILGAVLNFTIAAQIMIFGDKSALKQSQTKFTKKKKD
jgi:mannose-P-dolichol utilization defect protein 1